MRRTAATLLLGCVTVSLLATPAGAAPHAGTITRVSLRDDGTETNRYDFWPSLNADGTVMAFGSEDRHILVDRKTKGTELYVRNLVTGVTELITQSPSGRHSANNESRVPTLTADASLVSFESYASNLVRHDDNAASDIFVRDLRTGTTTLVSRRTDGLPANGSSFEAAIAADGSAVAFSSEATNLDDADENYMLDVFLVDLATGVTTLVSRGVDGTSADGDSEGPAISADGTKIVYTSDASDLVAGDLNRAKDVFLFDTILGTTTLLSRDAAGGQVDDYSRALDISADGRRVTFSSRADDIVPIDNPSLRANVFLLDIATGKTVLVSHGPGGISGNGDSMGGSLSATGTTVAFSSYATNLIPVEHSYASTHVYAYDALTDSTVLVSQNEAGEPGDDDSDNARIAADGQSVGFISLAPNLVAGDLNDEYDIFVARHG